MAGLMGVLWMLCWLRQRERSENVLCRSRASWMWPSPRGGGLGELGLWTLFRYLLRMRAMFV